MLWVWFGAFAQPTMASRPLINQPLFDSIEDLIDDQQYAEAEKRLTQLKARLGKHADAQSLFGYHRHNGSLLFARGNVSEAIAEFESALEVAHKIQDSLKIGLINSELGNTYAMQGNYKSALEHYNIALKLLAKDSRSYNNTIFNMSLTYRGLNQYDKALKILAEGKAYFAKKKDYRNLGVLENNMGEIYREDLVDLELAQVHYRKAIAANIKAGSNKDLSQSYHNMANVFINLNQLDSALHYAQLSMLIKKKLGHEGNMARAHFLLGDVYNNMQKADLAVEHFNKSLALCKKYQLLEGIYHNHSNLGQVHLQRGNLVKSEKHFLAAAQVAESSEDLHIVSSSQRDLYELYKKKGDFKKALHYNENLALLTDSMAQLKAEQNLNEIRTKYEADLAQSENDVLKEKEKVQNMQIAGQQRLLILSAIFITLLILVSVWLLKILRQRNTALAGELKSKAEIEEQHKKLLQSEKELQQSNDLKNKILSVLGHDLRNPLNNISTLLGAMSSSGLTEAEAEQVLTYLKKETEISHIILKEILAWARIQMMEEGKYIETINAHSLVNEVIDIHSHKAREKSITITTDGDSVEFLADKNQMKSVLSNLIFNGIKFSKRGGDVHVHIDKDEQYVQFLISDSGVGIAPHVLENLNKRHKVILENGTGNERGTGIGLRMVNDFVEDHKGTLKFANNTDGGALISVYIPLQQP